MTAIVARLGLFLSLINDKTRKIFTRLLEISRKVDKSDRTNLDLCAKSLVCLGEYAFAADCYARMGDVGSQLDILIKAGKWDKVSYSNYFIN